MICNKQLFRHVCNASIWPLTRSLVGKRLSVQRQNILEHDLPILLMRTLKHAAY